MAGSNNSGLFSGEMDPEVAALIGMASEDNADDAPDFSQLFDEQGQSESNEPIPGAGEIDMSVKSFQRPTKLEDDPKPVFNDKNYYKIALTGEGEPSKRVHTLLGQFLQATDPQDRSMHRSRLIPAYWELFRSIAGKITSGLPEPKRMLLRFGMLLPTMVSPEQRTMLSKVILDNQTNEPIFYVDEWLKAVSRGQINVSATDETKPSQRRAPQKINALLEKTRGRKDAQLNLIRTAVQEMESLEQELREKVDVIAAHDTRREYEGLAAPYNDFQRNAIGEISTIMRRLTTLNKELSRNYRELDGMSDQLQDLHQKEEEVGAVQVDAKAITEEANTIRQMTKLAIGRQGNHFPLVMKQYLRAALFNVGTRENVLNMLAEVEYLDPGVFLRTFKMQTNRIVPNIVLLPCYGDQGICWEPFERYNRASSRGRLAIPMYPKDLRNAVVAALADLRWQIAKEKAQHYWMEEGLTGWYYQWFEGKKGRGDVKDAFIQDYILWIGKESEGTQKLDREVRDIFWRYMPFPQEVRDRLKNRGFVYAELHKKDLNRSMSDGY
ncbi:MAG: hypothetical protein ACLFP4_02065 [Spirochaetales bacterium]